MINKKDRRYPAAMVLVLPALAFFSMGASHSPQQESFRGLQGIYVSAERLDPRIEKDGLTDDQIRTDVVSQLRLAGIKVLSKKEWFDTEGSPYLYVNVNILKLHHLLEIRVWVVDTVEIISSVVIPIVPIVLTLRTRKLVHRISNNCCLGGDWITKHHYKYSEPYFFHFSRKGQLLYGQ